MIEGPPSGVDSAFDFLHSLPSGGERSAQVLECSNSIKNYENCQVFKILLDLMSGAVRCPPMVPKVSKHIKSGAFSWGNYLGFSNMNDTPFTEDLRKPERLFRTPLWFQQQGTGYHMWNSE